MEAIIVEKKKAIEKAKEDYELRRQQEKISEQRKIRENFFAYVHQELKKYDGQSRVRLTVAPNVEDCDLNELLSNETIANELEITACCKICGRAAISSFKKNNTRECADCLCCKCRCGAYKKSGSSYCNTCAEENARW